MVFKFLSDTDVTLVIIGMLKNTSTGNWKGYITCTVIIPQIAILFSHGSIKSYRLGMCGKDFLFRLPLASQARARELYHLACER